MQWEELPTPTPGPGQVLVRVEAASVNFLDVQKRRGELVGQAFYRRGREGEPDLPATLGSQGVGVVVEARSRGSQYQGGRSRRFRRRFVRHACSRSGGMAHSSPRRDRDPASGRGNESGIPGLRVHTFRLPGKARRLVPDPCGGWRDRASALSDGKDARGSSDLALPRPGRKPNLSKTLARTRSSFPKRLILPRKQGGSRKAAE